MRRKFYKISNIEYWVNEIFFLDNYIIKMTLELIKAKYDYIKLKINWIFQYFNCNVWLEKYMVEFLKKKFSFGI